MASRSVPMPQFWRGSPYISGIPTVGNIRAYGPNAFSYGIQGRPNVTPFPTLTTFLDPQTQKPVPYPGDPFPDQDEGYKYS